MIINKDFIQKTISKIVNHFYENICINQIIKSI